MMIEFANIFLLSRILVKHRPEGLWVKYRACKETEPVKKGSMGKATNMNALGLKIWWLPGSLHKLYYDAKKSEKLNFSVHLMLLLLAIFVQPEFQYQQ